MLNLGVSMKKLLCGLLALTSFTAFASEALISKDLAGSYKLTRSKDNEIQSCNRLGGPFKTLNISVDEQGVYFNSALAYKSEDAGCKSVKEEGGLSKTEKKCTTFSDSRVTVTTKDLFFSGYAQSTFTIALDQNDSSKLIIKNDVRSFPVPGWGSAYEFTCNFERVK